MVVTYSIDQCTYCSSISRDRITDAELLGTVKTRRDERSDGQSIKGSVKSL